LRRSRARTVTDRENHLAFVRGIHKVVKKKDGEYLRTHTCVRQRAKRQGREKGLLGDRLGTEEGRGSCDPLRGEYGPANFVEAKDVVPDENKEKEHLTGSTSLTNSDWKSHSPHIAQNKEIRERRLFRGELFNRRMSVQGV